jgi:hypothetical protein
LFLRRDRHDLKAFLNEEGSALELIESNNPAFFHEEAKQMHEEEAKLKKKASMACEKTKELHQVTATRVSKKKGCRLQSSRYNFPDGISLQSFGDGLKGIQLKNRFRMQPVILGEDKDGDDITWYGPYVFWVFEVDKEVRLLNESSDDSDDDFAIFTERMSKVSSAQGAPMNT